MPDDLRTEYESQMRRAASLEAFFAKHWQDAKNASLAQRLSLRAIWNRSRGESRLHDLMCEAQDCLILDRDLQAALQFYEEEREDIANVLDRLQAIARGIDPNFVAEHSSVNRDSNRNSAPDAHVEHSMHDFDPNSSDVDPRGARRPRTERARRESKKTSGTPRRNPEGDYKGKALALLDSKVTRFIGLWAIVTVLLVQIVKLFSRSFSFTENYSGVLAVTFIIAAGLRYMAAQKLNVAGVVAVGVVLERLSKPIRGLLGTAWTFLLLGFILMFIGQCSQNPNMPVENIFILSLDKYWSWLGTTWQKLLWYFGWS